MRVTVSLAFAALFTASLAYFPRAALAIPCGPPFTLPSSGETIPASASVAVFWGQKATSTTVSRHGGDAVAGTMKSLPDDTPYFVPASPFLPGQYDVHHESPCAGGTIGDSTFFVTPAMPLPKAVGALRHVRNARVEGSVYQMFMPPAPTFDAEVSDVAFDVSDSYRPYVPVTIWTSYVDGTEWGGAMGTGSVFGSFEAGDLDKENPNVFGIVRFFAACGAAPAAVAGRGLAQGKHRVTLEALVPDVLALRTPPLDIDVVCETDAGPPPLDKGADDDGSGAPSSSAGSSNGGSSANGANAADPNATATAGCGCHATPKPVHATALLSALALVGTFALRRKRRH